MAQLNDQTQENVSIYLTQVETSQNYTQSYSTSICEKSLEENCGKEEMDENYSLKDEEIFKKNNETELTSEIDQKDPILVLSQPMKPKNEDDRLNFICSDLANIEENEPVDKSGAICIDDTIMSLPSDEETVSSLMDSNILDQNMDIIDETNFLEEPGEYSSNEPILIEEVIPSFNSKKRSIQVIQINDEESNEEAKKFKGEESNESIREIDEKNTPEPNSQVLRMLDEYEAQEKTIPVNDQQALDDVWNNFGENQFEDFFVYSEPNEFQVKSPIEKEDIIDKIETHVHPQDVSYDSEEIPRDCEEVRRDFEEISRDFNEVRRDNREISRDNKEIPKDSEETLKEIEKDSTEDYDAYECTKTPVNIKKKSSKNPISRLVGDEEEGNVTPMPSYVNMDTPSLRDELKRFGVKALPKKQAVKKLVEIYEFTHRHKLKRSASCVNLSNINHNRFPKTNSDLPFNEIESAAKQMNLERTEKPKSKKKLKKTVSDIGFQHKPEVESTARSIIKIGTKTKIAEKTIDEKMIELASEDSELEENFSSQTKNVRQKKSMSEEELREFVHEFITKNKRIYMDVLNYVPLDFDCIHSTMQITTAPRKVNNKMLMKVLDEFCITFTLKSLNTRGNSKVKTKKKI